MCLELPSTYWQSHITELLVLKQQAKVIWETALWHFELYRIWLSRDVDTICYYTHLNKIWHSNHTHANPDEDSTVHISHAYATVRHLTFHILTTLMDNNERCHGGCLCVVDSIFSPGIGGVNTFTKLEMFLCATTSSTNLGIYHSTQLEISRFFP